MGVNCVTTAGRHPADGRLPVRQSAQNQAAARGGDEERGSRTRGDCSGSKCHRHGSPDKAVKMKAVSSFAHADSEASSAIHSEIMRRIGFRTARSPSAEPPPMPSRHALRANERGFSSGYVRTLLYVHAVTFAVPLLSNSKRCAWSCMGMKFCPRPYPESQTPFPPSLRIPKTPSPPLPRKPQ
ncbi:hypothetical protein SKAU_G00123700 [Synaphobranchus kaupii]|uniref:Uncharacterized protein n=1 Tax=Synaphobranchus kaupii TaxID=118154 RepID=A0A9Q1FPF5_SYNKA|nr:hypothetical protein SKAU_G00123700 [Synaphobranchus kaupii]